LTGAAQDFCLCLKNLTKRYDSNVVVDAVDLEFKRGEIVGLLGANGAGKSTVCRMMAGLVSPTQGEMMIRGRRYAPRTKTDAERQGIQIVQQELNLIPTLSVAENLYLNRLPSCGGWIRRQELKRRAAGALQRVGLDQLSPDTLVGDLGVGTQQMVEIAAAFDRQCELLILDEPTAALSLKEAETLFQRLAELRSQGMSMVYVSHRLDEIQRLTDRIVVLRDGRLVAERRTRDCQTESMIQWMTGESHKAAESNRTIAAVRPGLLRIAGWSSQSSYRDISFDVGFGEIFGIAGLVGSGRTELLRGIFGADRVDEGRIQLSGRQSTRPFQSPAEAVRSGVAMVTEDRKTEGLLLSQPIRVNASIGMIRQMMGRWGGIRRREECQTVSELCRKMAVRYESLEQDAGTLSGGNQQKVVIAKWLGVEAQLFLVDEPTRGIDISARQKIYEVLRGLAAAGKGMVMVSSDLDELFEVCDRIMVMSAGRSAGIFTREAWSRDAIMEACFSHYVKSNAGV
jgi:ribose transport system ATP-binding protein